MKSVYIGFAECADENCCYMISGDSFPWSMRNIEDVLLRRLAMKGGSTTIVCEGLRLQRQVMKLIERVLCDEIGSEQMMAERSLVVRKWYGQGKETTSHNIDICSDTTFSV